MYFVILRQMTQSGLPIAADTYDNGLSDISRYFGSHTLSANQNRLVETLRH